MKQALRIILGLALVGSALTLNAQPCQQGGPGGPGGAKGICPLLDTDGNGVLSAKEILAAPKIVRELDTNKDDQVTQAEFCAGVQCKRHAENGKRCMAAGKGQCLLGEGGFMARFDLNADGVLSRAEIDQLPALLAELDKNGDAQLTADEFCPRKGQGTGPGCARGCGGCGRQ